MFLKSYVQETFVKIDFLIWKKSYFFKIIKYI